METFDEHRKIHGIIRALGKGGISSANVSQVITVDKAFLTEKAGKLTRKQIQQIEEGLRLVLSL
jgi:mRNA-degrading endonuclease toxin of MazEF toxin-antitoxin module